MKKPVARPIVDEKPDTHETRQPRAFAPPKKSQQIEALVETDNDEALIDNAPKRRHWAWRLLVGAGGILVSLALYLAAERLILDLFQRFEWLGWAATGIAAILALAALTIIFIEIRGVLQLRSLDRLRSRAAEAILADNASVGRAVTAQLQALYASRPDLARPRKSLDEDLASLFDGAEMIKAAERNLMTPLDARAHQLTSAAARRVALVTAISPRALIDIAFVAYESIKLGRAIAEIYGARPGFLGSWRLFGAILGHLAITGGLALGEDILQQILGQGLAAKLSARLGEGIVNGLMTARVGIAAMRVTRPLPFEALKQPVVMDFATELARLNAGKDG